MRHRFSGSTTVVLLASVAACAGQAPPPPVLRVTSPHRGFSQEGGQVEVTGTALPNANGDPVTRVTVNGVPAKLGADGSFSQLVEVPDGATILETVASSEYGGEATDARAVQSGHRLPVGSNIDRAVTASLSADAFAKLSGAAGPFIKTLDLPARLAPLQPMANLGDGFANVQLSVTSLTFDDVKVTLKPVDGGLEFSTEIDGLNAAATAVYAGAIVPDGTTTITFATDKITISGMLVVTPQGTSGFTTTIASPVVKTTKLNLQANGLVGQVLTLVNDNLASTVEKVTTKAAESGLEPLLNDALGALGGPKQITVLGETLDLQASPAAVAFTAAGAVVTMNLQTKIAGSEGSPGFILTPNGTPTLDPSAGIQLGLSDDLVNEMLAEIHALGVLDLHIEKDFGLFDTLDINSALPPMVSADNTDGTLRLLLCDNVATLSDHGTPVVAAAINAQVDLEILRGANPNQIALQFGKVHLWANVDDSTTPDGGSEVDVSGVAASGIDVQLASLTQFLITVPVPSVAGVSLDSLAMHADSGYIIVSGEIH